MSRPDDFLGCLARATPGWPTLQESRRPGLGNSSLAWRGRATSRRARQKRARPVLLSGGPLCAHGLPNGGALRGGVPDSARESARSAPRARRMLRGRPRSRSSSVIGQVCSRYLTANTPTSSTCPCSYYPTVAGAPAQVREFVMRTSALAPPRGNSTNCPGSASSASSCR